MNARVWATASAGTVQVRLALPPEQLELPARSPASKLPLAFQSTQPASTPLPLQATVCANESPRSTLTVAGGASLSSSPVPKAPPALVSSLSASALNSVPSGSTDGPSRRVGWVVSATVLPPNRALVPVGGTPPEKGY